MKILPVICLLLAFFCYPSSAQETIISERISTSLEKYTSTFPQEKLYLHFDKEYYSPGDTIWFKAYQVNASTHEPDSLSRIIYVDLIGPQNTILTKLKLKSKSGFAHGDIFLSDTLPAGTYRVRAYTNWMRNFDSDFFYTKNIQLYAPHIILPSASARVNTQTNLNPNTQITSDTSSASKIQIDLQFFPEGGNLLDGLPVKVAFKAVSSSGKGLKVAGSIVDNDGNHVTVFGSNPLGMGGFNMLPQSDKQYFAQLEGRGLPKKRYALPQVIKYGYTLSLNYFKPGYIRVNARTNTGSGPQASQTKVMTLIGQCRGEVYFTAKTDISKKGYFFIDVSKEDFPTGIVQFTLFDDKDVPQSERLAFINHQDNLKIEINTNKNDYAPREKVELEIGITDEHGVPVSTNLSLSVTDVNRVPKIDSLRENILTNLLLTSDLKGFIESPQMYFRDTTKQTQQAIDLLMLTHGWRRFAWKEVLSDSTSLPKFAAEKELSFSGSLANSNKPLEEKQLTLMLMSTPPQVLQSPLGKTQEFYFGLPDFQDTVNVVLQSTNVKGKQREIKVSLNETEMPVITGSPAGDDIEEIPQEISRVLSRRTPTSSQKEKRESNVVLDEVAIKAKVKREMVGFMAGQKIDVEAVEKSMTFDYINIFHFIAAQGKGTFRVIDGKYGDALVFGDKNRMHMPTYLIDGVEYEATPTTFPYPYLSVRDVLIRRIKNLEIGEKFSFEGKFVKYIIINTYKDGYRRSYPAGINTFKVAGLSKVREFYSPRYQVTEKPKNEDNRSGLYWNPNVKTDKNGRAKLSFYNSDKATAFSINVEGVSGDGNIGTASHNVPTSAQEKLSTQINTSLKKYTSTFLQEKLYLHFDKENYSPGDTIWFKANQVNASSHKPDSLSRIIYVDLIGPKNTILSQLKLKSKSGFAHGDISLSDTLPTGTYRVRAYTNWMRNFDSDFFYTKNIQLYAPGISIASGGSITQAGSDPKTQIASDTSAANKIQIDLQFFPEGGSLLYGLPGKVAFKAVSSSGRGVKVAGSIVDNNGNHITSFNSSSLGMGVFDLMPKSGKQFFAQLGGMGFPKKRYPLPQAIKNGYTLSLNYFKPGYIRVNAKTNSGLGTPSSQTKIMTLIGQCRAKVYFTAKADISEKGYFFIDVPKANFPTGIVQFTLFDDNNVPQSERLAFINHQDNLKIEVNTNKKDYAPREKVELEIRITDEDGAPVSTNLSLSVTDANQVPEIDSLRENILTNLLLTSDLKGNVESPQTYLRDTTKETQQALDLLMLTHGWRRFAWKEVLSDSTSLPKFAAEKELSFSGSLANGNKAIEENRLTLMLMSTPPQVLQSPIAKNQDFYFGLPDFQDSVGVVLQTTNAKGKQREMQVSVDETQAPEITGKLVDYEMEIPEAIKTASTPGETTINQKKKNEPNVVLNEVVIKKKIQGDMVGFMPGQKIDVEAVEKSMNFDYINVFYLIAAQGKGVFRVEGDLLIAGMGRNRHCPTFLLNGVEYVPGVPVPSYETVKHVDIRRIKYLEIGEKFISSGFTKYIIINTYQDGYRRSYPPGITSFKVAGFTRVREFYSPQYQLPTSIKTDDNRSTIYWNPNVKTDKSGKARLSFYNSDKARSFHVSAEGISDDGNICATHQHLNPNEK